MTPPSASTAKNEPQGPADIASVLRRGALPVAPLAMPLQPLEGEARAILPRLFASLSLRTGN